MKRFLTYAVFLLLLCLAAQPSLSAQQRAAASSGTASGGLSQAEVDRIIRAFTTKETEFRRALNQYSFKRDAVLQSIGMGGQISGEYHRTSNFTFDDKGNRYEKINFFPMPSFPSVTAEDIEDLGGVNAFALEASKFDQYKFTYVGKERIDELDLYVFDVAPKVMPDPKRTKERLFQGRVWVDDRDLQIVKARGKGVPETKDNKYPNFEIYREQIDGKYWFPTYAYADEELVFGNGTVLHVRARVRYTDYARVHATVKITEVDADDEQQEQKSAPSIKPSSTPGQTPSTRPAEVKPPQGPPDVGVLNEKATELPRPNYPLLARQNKVGGVVTVRVVVDESGRVIKAEAVDGPPTLRRAAVEAAYDARFSPTLVSGQPVKVTGVITYTFTP
ncbi:MAG TPA: TonB family protein [Pyrinomonadaceae bacterium]|jgi:TonB family protein